VIATLYRLLIVSSTRASDDTRKSVTTIKSYAPRALTRARRRSCVCVVAVLSACGHVDPPDAHDVASLYLTCTPASRGVHCRLLALSRDASRPARDVTAKASWCVSGIVGARISDDGTVDAPASGDVEITAQFEGRCVEARIGLVRDRPGRMLATVRGHVYAETHGILRPIADARVEVVGGPSAGLATTTCDDGSFELAGVVPGKIDIRAAKIGYDAGESSTQLHPGDNRLSVLIDALPSVPADAFCEMRRDLRSPHACGASRRGVARDPRCNRDDRCTGVHQTPIRLARDAPCSSSRRYLRDRT
jgi:carboxypeptidase family protein